MSVFLRLLTLFTYFLPFCFFFTTCQRGQLKVAYNIEEALTIKENIQQTKLAPDSVKVQDTMHSETVVLRDLHDKLADRKNRFKFDLTKIINMAVFPSDYSISGIGVFEFYKNIFGKICIGLSILISVLYLILWKLLRKKKVSYIFICINVFSILAFIAICFISKVDVLFGVWVLLILLLIQFFLEYLDRQIKTIEEKTDT